MYSRPLRLLKLLLVIFCLIILVYEIVDVYFKVTKKKIKRITLSKQQKYKTNDFEEIISKLEPFYVRLPNFFDEEAKSWFYNSTYYRINSKYCPNDDCEKYGVLFNDTNAHLQYRISFVRNGLYVNDDCGYNYGDSQARRQFQYQNETTDFFDKLFIYTVPDGWAFQHFLDGVGPKLSHSRKYLSKYPDSKVLIERGTMLDRSVHEIWQMLGVSSSRMVRYTPIMRAGARLLINPCRTAAIHPYIWNSAREMYWEISNLTKPFDERKRKNLIYIQRTSTNARNGGRLILNEDNLVSILKEYSAKHSLNYIQYDHSKDPYHIRYRIEMFLNSRIIIGVHSGALSNMNFAQANTTIIEIMPYRSSTPTLPLTCSTFNPNDLKACAGYILYTQSQLLNQSYWILPTVTNNQGNLEVDLTRFKKLIELV